MIGSGLHVVIDARMIRHSGIGVYLNGLLSGLETLFQEDANLGNRLSMTFLGGHSLFEHKFPGSINESSQRIAFKVSLYGLREQLAAPGRIRVATHPPTDGSTVKRASEKVVAFWPHYNFPVFWRGPLVVTVHDLIHSQYPTRRGTRTYQKILLGALRRRMLRADRGGPQTHVLTDSRHVKVLLQREWGFPPHRVWNVGAPIPSLFRPPKSELEWQRALGDTLKAFRLPKRFWLTVGLFKPHKNFLWLLDRISGYWASGEFPGIELVMAGTQQARELLQRLDTDSRLRGRIKVLPTVTDEQLRALYWGADALIYPSLSEGFGLPLVEAMACGTAAISARRAPMTETSDGIAWFFEPDRVPASGEPDELLEALRAVSAPAEGDDRRKSERESIEADIAARLRRGIARAKEFNPEDFATRVLEVWRRTVEEQKQKR